MKIELLINSKKINIDLEKIKEKNNLIEKLISINNTQNELDNDKTDLGNLKKKDIIENLFFLIADRNKNLSLTFKDIQNIISKTNDNEKFERSIKNLFDIINMSWKPNLILHENTIISLNNLINNEKQQNDSFSFHSYRRQNIITINELENFIEEKIKSNIIVDFNQISPLYTQFIHFIHQKESQLTPFIKMQIIHLHNLAISPFYENNFLISKIISAWYLIFMAKNNNKWRYFPIQSYFECLNWNRHQYYRKVKESLEANDYTNFIAFVIDEMIKFQQCKIICARILKNKRKQRIFLAKHQAKFLFVIIYKDLNEFDWKMFKRKTDWKGSKQFILANLKKLMESDLLEEDKIQNRKYFCQSKFLKEEILRLRKKFFEHLFTH